MKIGVIDPGRMDSSMRTRPMRGSHAVKPAQGRPSPDLK